MLGFEASTQPTVLAHLCSAALAKVRRFLFLQNIRKEMISSALTFEARALSISVAPLPKSLGGNAPH